MARINVLLTDDVLDLGLAGEIHKVAGGFARNYLIPRGFAILATKGAMKQAEEIREAGIRRRAQERENAEAQAQLLEGKKILFQAKAGENDRLYGSVTTAEIAEKLSETAGFEIDRRRINPSAALRDLGIFDLQYRIMHEVSATFTVGVVRDEEGWEEAEARAQGLLEAAEAEEVQTAANEMVTDAAEVTEEVDTEIEEAAAEMVAEAESI